MNAPSRLAWHWQVPPGGISVASRSCDSFMILAIACASSSREMSNFFSTLLLTFILLDRREPMPPKSSNCRLIEQLQLR